MLETALSTGICSMGADVILVGPMPTPGIAFITNNMDADAGVVISASHNPYEDNGIKIFSNSGYKLTRKQEEEIEDLIAEGNLSRLLPPSEDIGKAFREADALGRYIVFLRRTLHKSMSLEGMKIAVDCANGATYKVAPTLFSEMRAEVIPINVNPDGTNINHDAGSLHPEKLAKAVVENKADLGLAFDGDGDRLIAVDEKGNVITGDKIIAICAKNLKDMGELKNNAVVTTIMSNIGLIKAFEELDIKRIESPVGDRLVLEQMLQNDAILGGEDSGHVIFLEHHTTGDGILTALQLLNVIQNEKKPLSQLASVMKLYPQVLENLKVREKIGIENIPALKKAIEEVKSELGASGRILVRYSGTQPLLRIMAEGPTMDKIKECIDRIYKIAEKELS